jgi:hypothetical protein
VTGCGLLRVKWHLCNRGASGMQGKAPGTPSCEGMNSPEQFFLEIKKKFLIYWFFPGLKYSANPFCLPQLTSLFEMKFGLAHKKEKNSRKIPGGGHFKV